MEELIRQHPGLAHMSAVQILTAMQGVGVETKLIEDAVKKATDYQKKNKRISKSIETVIKF
jgi:hypothetical protein